MPEAPQYPGAPRWVKFVGIAAAIVVAVAAVAALVGSGHGPHRHFGGTTSSTADAGR